MLKNKGFSLLEVLIVLLMIGIFVTLAIPSVEDARKRTTAAQVVRDFGHVKRTIEYFIMEIESELDGNQQLPNSENYNPFSNHYDIPEAPEGWTYLINVTSFYVDFTVQPPDSPVVIWYLRSFIGGMQTIVYRWAAGWHKYIYLPGATYTG